MAAPKPVANALKCRLTWTGAGLPNATVGWHMSYTGGPPSSNDLILYCGDIQAAAGALAAHFTSDLAIAECLAMDLSSSSGNIGLSTPSIIGTRTPGGIDASMCVVSSFKINRRYRGGKPRAYWPFGDSGELASRVAWSAAFVASVENDLNVFFAAISNKTHGALIVGSHIAISFFQGFTVVTNPKTGRAENVPTPRATPLIDPVVGITTSTKPGNQRRRL